jgi:hypothetical protein
VQYLLKYKAVEEHITDEDNYALRFAAYSGHLEVVQCLLEHKAVKEQITARNNLALGLAAYSGHLEVVRCLLEYPAVQEEITAMDNFALRYAAERGHHKVVYYLLQYEQVFSYAEMHEREYSNYVNPFVANQLEELKTAHDLFATEHPEQAFDVPAEKAGFYFYVLRNLIRRSREDHANDIRLLLEIPAVKARVIADETDELLLLVVTTNNQPTSRLLLAIPEVYQRAQEHDFYAYQQAGGIDLRRLAQHNESSMRALTPGEEKRLSSVKQHYQSKLDTKTKVNSIIKDLKTTLINRYHENPARIGQVVLPLEWQDFEAMSLTEDDREKALKAYYQHKDHTALRCLMSEQLAGFEELIALLWLAATDKAIEATDGMTYEGRIDHFIGELAHIRRAHNWDKANEQGSQYDDLEEDKPSCRSGVKNRLLQAVIGHPLLDNILTKEILNQEIYDFVRGHFTQRCAKKTAILQACSDCFIKGEKVPTDLKKLDIDKEKQAQFYTLLNKKYGPQLSENVDLIEHFTDAFVLQDDEAHILNFFYRANLKALLQPTLEESASPSSHGFFSGHAHSPEEGTSSSLDQTIQQAPR